MDIHEDIHTFFRRVTEIQNAIVTISTPFFQRILLLSLLDALAHCAYPNKRNNRERFVSLIDNYTEWSDKDRYGLRQLNICLNNIKDPSKYPTLPYLIREVQGRLRRWPVEHTFLFPEDVDPTRQELKKFIEEGIEKIIEKVRYPSLMWVQRNYAVHELRYPSGGMDFDISRPDPYYYYLIKENTGEGSWVHFFPIELFSKLVKESATNLERDFVQNNINPWKRFEHIPDWCTGT